MAEALTVCIIIQDRRSTSIRESEILGTPLPSVRCACGIEINCSLSTEQAGLGLHTRGKLPWALAPHNMHYCADNLTILTRKGCL